MYRRSKFELVFVEVPAPIDVDLQAVLHKIIGRLMKLLTRRGVLIRERDATYLAEGDTDFDDERTLARATFWLTPLRRWRDKPGN